MTSKAKIDNHSRADFPGLPHFKLLRPSESCPSHWHSLTHWDETITTFSFQIFSLPRLEAIISQDKNFDLNSLLRRWLDLAVNFDSKQMLLVRFTRRIPPVPSAKSRVYSQMTSAAGPVETAIRNKVGESAWYKLLDLSETQLPNPLAFIAAHTCRVIYHE